MFKYYSEFVRLSIVGVILMSKTRKLPDTYEEWKQQGLLEKN